ncbi:unnamed protein product [Onchocerca flexuosa]|uniref:CBM21 domain-containing protein n=1 Tax=Onchocerca flexuosa TaxID=387005 RepID=A0A183I5I1_9BILA|nr:unnamed protein product [Onchocerca flexuosa]
MSGQQKMISVYVRYSTDNWRTNIEAAGRYKNSVENGAIDKFTFIISLPIDFPIGATCEFCIRYVVKGTIYWDNNYGANYIIRAVENIPGEMKFKMNLTSKSFKPSDNAYKISQNYEECKNFASSRSAKP